MAIKLQQVAAGAELGEFLQGDNVPSVFRAVAANGRGFTIVADPMIPPAEHQYPKPLNKGGQISPWTVTKIAELRPEAR